MKTTEQLLRLRCFWGATIFALGIFWGLANIVYCPIAALTSIVGSSWPEVFLILLGGLLTFIASIRAFYRRRSASLVLFLGGLLLLALAIAAHLLLPSHAHGIINLCLLYMAGGIPFALGLFGAITDYLGWPTPRENP